MIYSYPYTSQNLIYQHSSKKSLKNLIISLTFTKFTTTSNVSPNSVARYNKQKIYLNSALKLPFLVNCPLYSTQRKILEDICNENCTRYKHFTEEQKFIFLMTNENEKIVKALGKYIANSLNFREKTITYFFS